MHLQAREFARVPLSLLTRLRLILFGHEDLAGIIFWAALVGFFGALASVLLTARRCSLLPGDFPSSAAFFWPRFPQDGLWSGSDTRKEC